MGDKGVDVKSQAEVEGNRGKYENGGVTLTITLDVFSSPLLSLGTPRAWMGRLA